MRTSLSLGLSRIGGLDLTAPVLLSSLPADNATGVADTVSPLITFNEDVFPGSGLITLRQNISGTWSDVETFDVATEIGLGPGQVYFAGTGVTINPTANLVAGREYAIRIAATAVQDGSGNFFAGVANDTTISFTVAAGDVIAPTIVSTNPVDGATGFPVASNLTITFSENVVFGTGLITLRENISGTWSDLETFDVVTEVGVGNGQVSISGAVLTINPTASLTASREYAIRIAPTAIRDAAANAFAGIADDTTFSFTSAPGAAPFTARFGHGTFQPSGTGNFNTNLYTASPPANGTYGNFSVTAGVISCNGAQTPGSYDVGGYPVQVLNDWRSVASTAELQGTNGLSFAGPNRTLCIREGAGADWLSTVSGEYGRRANFNGMTVLGDGPSVIADIWNAALDSRRHFNRLFLGAHRSITYRNLRVAPSTRVNAWDVTAPTWPGNVNGDLTFDECLVVASRPDPNFSYTGAASFPGAVGINFGSAQLNVGATFTNCRVIGGLRGYRLPVAGYLEMIGCESWYSYEDGVQIPSGGIPLLLGGNVFGVGLARVSDTSPGPHGDSLSTLGEGGNTVIEACAVFAGNHRGRSFNQTYYISEANTLGAQVHLRDSVVVDDPVSNIHLAQTNGSTIEHCATVSTPYIALPDPTPPGIRFGDVIFNGTNRLTNVVSHIGGGVNPGVIQTGNVSVSGYVAADWVAMYENWTVDSLQTPSLQKIMADLRTKPTGPGNGKGHRVTFTGSKNSDYVIAGGLAAPTLTSFAMTSTAALSAAATITTNTVLNPIFFAVVPVGTSVATPRDIKRRRLTGALVYGFTSVKNGDTAVALNLAGTLVAGTSYDVVAMQENGWTAVSTVSRTTFLAT